MDLSADLSEVWQETGMNPVLNDAGCGPSRGLLGHHPVEDLRQTHVLIATSRCDASA